MTDGGGPAESLRPLYHLTPSFGWLNDPCGLYYHNGTWHLFFQYNPSIAIWANIHWGHATSRDLVRFSLNETPALKPHATLGMPYTGSAVLDSGGTSGLCAQAGCPVLVFTHALGKDGGQHQSLAHSDDGGMTWVLYPQNPVLKAPAGLADFRDPKVLWHAPTSRWVMVLAAGDRVRFYASTDLRSWTELSRFGPVSDLATQLWECPDFFPLTLLGTAEQRWVLKADIVAGAGQAGYGRYFVGQFDGTSFTVLGPPDGSRIDGGADFYAAQSVYGAPGGRRIWLAWMNHWAYALTTPITAWRGVMSLPRELFLVQEAGAYKLVQQPVPELLALRAACPAVTAAPGSFTGNTALLSGVAGRSLEIDAELSVGTARTMGLKLLSGPPNQQTVVGFDAVTGEVFLDRRSSGNTGFHPTFGARHAIKLPLTGGRLKLRVFIDRSTVEVFAGDGRAVLSDLVFPDPTGQGLALFAEGGSAFIHHLLVYRLAHPAR